MGRKDIAPREQKSFSVGVDNLLLHVRPHGKSQTSFPASENVADTRRQADESLHAWFTRIVNGYYGEDPERASIEENVAVFADLRWQDNKLKYASIPVIVAEGPLDEFYLGASIGAKYLRLDVDYRTLGTPFSHPLAHVHSGDDDAPRFALDGGDCGNVLLDFLEFVYRTYVPKKWIAWARAEWLALRDDDDRRGRFDRLVLAFKDQKFEVLREESKTINELKCILRRTKDSLFKDHMDGEDRLILEYPLSRSGAADSGTAQDA